MSDLSRSNRSSVLTLLALLFVLGGCANEATRDDRSVVRDSAGVAIVESTAPIWQESPPARVAEEVLLQIGSADGSDGEPLHGVGSARWLDENRVALTHAGAEIRVYDLEGGLVQRFGREGEGPGEFRLASALSPLSDGRLLVADARLRRITVTEASGEVVGTTQLDGPLPADVGLVGDQVLVGIRRPVGNSDGPRIDRFVDSLVAVNVDTGAATVWAVTPGRQVVWRRFPNGLTGPFDVMISPRSTTAARGGRVVFGASDAYELKELDPQGQLVRIIRRVTPAGAITDELRRPVIDVWTERGSPPYAEPAFPDSLPFFRSILLGDTGGTWVEREGGGVGAAAEWDVFDPDGIYLGPVLLPNGFRPHDIRGNQMVGVWRDSLDVEYLQVRRIALPGSY